MLWFLNIILYIHVTFVSIRIYDVCKHGNDKFKDRLCNLFIYMLKWYSKLVSFLKLFYFYLRLYESSYVYVYTK